MVWNPLFTTSNGLVMGFRQMTEGSANYFPPSIFIWGIVVWTSLVRSIFQSDAECMDHGFHTKSGIVCALPLVSMQLLLSITK